MDETLAEAGSFVLGTEFWQRLLASEAPSERLWPVIHGARAGHFRPEDIDDWPGLSDADRLRAKAASGNLADRCGAQIVELQGLSRPLFVIGDTCSLSRPLIGIVGTRRISTYGKTVCTHFAETMARSGCTIVSGGAIGIDSVAHTAALDAGGPTVCVLPCGVDVAYPARHRDLFQRIKSQGCLMSPFACGELQRDHRLLMRNGIVAELCVALIVIEAPEDSGALITASAARDLGKPVYVVPGPVTQDTFRGSHQLIREGAVLVDSPQEVLKELGVDAVSGPQHELLTLSPSERTVFETLCGTPLSPESVGNEAQLPVNEVLTALTMLEISGLAVRTVEGYSRKP